jgi:hypothetical protein
MILRGEPLSFYDGDLFGIRSAAMFLRYRRGGMPVSL